MRAGVGMHVHGESRWNGDARFAVSGLRWRWQRATERAVGMSERGVGRDRGGVCCRVDIRFSRARVYIELELPRADRRQRRSSPFLASFPRYAVAVISSLPFPSLARYLSPDPNTPFPSLFFLSFLSSPLTHADARF
jgi:hypothetical protein